MLASTCPVAFQKVRTRHKATLQAASDYATVLCKHGRDVLVVRTFFLSLLVRGMTSEEACARNGTGRDWCGVETNWTGQTKPGQDRTEQGGAPSDGTDPPP